MSEPTIKIDTATRVSPTEDTMLRELSGEAVLLNLDTGQYFGLDEVGTAMWNALTGSTNLQQAYETLLSDYDVEAETLRQDLVDLLEKLLEHGLLEITTD